MMYVLFLDLNVLFILIFKERDTNKHKPNGVPRLQVKYYISRKNSLSNKPEDSLDITSRCYNVQKYYQH